MKPAKTTRKNIGSILSVCVLIIIPGVLFAALGVAAMLTPCHVSTLALLPIMLFFLAAVTIALGVYTLFDDWKR